MEKAEKAIAERKSAKNSKDSVKDKAEPAKKAEAKVEKPKNEKAKPETAKAEKADKVKTRREACLKKLSLKLKKKQQKPSLRKKPLFRLVMLKKNARKACNVK